MREEKEGSALVLSCEMLDHRLGLGSEVFLQEKLTRLEVQHAGFEF